MPPGLWVPGLTLLSIAGAGVGFIVVVVVVVAAVAVVAVVVNPGHACFARLRSDPT